MEAQHTHGPWEWRQPYPDAGYYQLVAVGEFGVHPNGSKIYPVICDDVFAGDEYSPSIDVHGANARLIAAAPQLLEACQAVLNAIKRTSLEGKVIWIQPPYVLPPVHETATERLQAAITAATS